MYKCLNHDCEEEWDVNSKGYLVPGFYNEQGRIESGWVNKEDTTECGCPSCNENWEWKDK